MFIQFGKTLINANLIAVWRVRGDELQAVSTNGTIVATFPARVYEDLLKKLGLMV